MTIRNSKLAAAAFLAGSVAFFAAPLGAVTLSGVQAYFASGPASLLVGQTANACAVNAEDSPLSILIALLTADSSSLLASRQVTLQPGAGVCVSYTRPIPQPGNVNQVSPNVYAVAIAGGRLDANARIVQFSPGGGCIVASLQIQVAAPNNTPSQTILYVPMLKYTESKRQNDD